MLHADSNALGNVVPHVRRPSPNWSVRLAVSFRLKEVSCDLPFPSLRMNLLYGKIATAGWHVGVVRDALIHAYIVA